MMRRRGLQLALIAAGATLLLTGGASVAADDVGAPDSLTPASSTLTLGHGASATIDKTLHLNASPPKADIVLAIDTTGSMGTAISQAQADAVDLMNRIKVSIPGSRFAVVDFKDYPFSPFGCTPAPSSCSQAPEGFGGDFPYLLRQSLTTSNDAVSAALAPMSTFPGDGGDNPESYNRVIYESYSDTALGRDPNAPGFLVVLGDQFPHDATLATDFPDCPDTPPTDPGRDNETGTSDDLKTRAVLDGAKANHINVSMITYNPTASVTSCWSQLTSFTGGQQVDRTGSSSLADQIVNLINEDAARVDEVNFTVTPSSFASWVKFTPPPTYGPFTAPIDVPFEETITVPSATAPGTYVFQVHAVADGAVRADESVTVTVTNQVVSNPQLTADQSSRPPGLDGVPFSSIPVSLIPAFAGNAAAAPGGSIPGGSIPGGSIPGGSIPGGSIPGGSITFGSIGLGALPGGSIPGGSIPGGSIPGGSIGFQRVMQSLLLSQIPLQNPASGATWDQILAGTALAGRPLSTLTLFDVALDATAWTRLKALPLRDVPFVTSLWGGVPLAAWLTGNATLDQLTVPTGFSTWAQALDGSGGSSSGLDTTQNTLFGVGIAGQLGRTDVGSLTVGSLPGGSIPGGSIPALQILLTSINIGATRLATVSLDSLSNRNDIVNCTGSFACAGKTLGQAAAATAIKSTATLGLLLSGLPAGDPARNMTLSELIFGFLPASLYPWEQLNLQGLQKFAGTGQNVNYHLDFDVDCAAAAKLSSVSIGLPAGEFPVEGSSNFSVGPVAGPLGAPIAAGEPTLTKGATVWTAKWTPAPTALCGTSTVTRHVRWNLTTYERLPIGEHTASGSVGTTEGSYVAGNQAPVLVTQNGEPANDDQATAPMLQKDTLYVGHIGAAGDLDVGKFALSGLAPGTKITAYLKVPDDADFDLVLSKPETPGVRSNPGGSIPGGSIPIENPSEFVDNSSRALPPETQSDVPQAIPGGSIPGGSIPGGSIPGGSIPGGSISANRGAATESAQIVTNGETGNLVTTVSGYNNSSSNNPYVLRIQVTPPPPLPPCPAVTNLSSATPGVLPSLASIPVADRSSYKTLFLVNRQRMVGLYGATATDELLNGTATALSPLQVIAARSEVKGLVLPVDGDQGVRDAYAAWDAKPCSIPAVQNVVRKINDVAGTYKAALPNVKYVAILGTDRAVPFWRQFDRGQIAPEVDEAAELAAFTNGLTEGNPLYAAAAQNYVLTDGAYGVRQKISWLGSDMPLPQDSVSRFVETPQDIGGQLQQYIDSNGQLDPKSELTTGDDFFSDSAAAADTALRAGFAGTSGFTADTLYPPLNPGWTKQNLIDHFFGKTPVPDLGAIYAHYNPWLAQPAGPTPITSLTQLASTADVLGGTELRNKLLWSIGCHGGLNIDNSYPGDAAKKKDWAETYGKGRAVWIANNGYGYDDTDSIALSGRLMWLFSQKLNRGTGSIGEQWVDALNTYYLSAGDWDLLDEKVMLQATFYGPPWSHFQTTSPAPAYTPPATPPKDGLDAVASLTVTPSIHENTTADGRSWWDVGGVSLSVPYRSIQPLTSQNVTVPSKHAHDAFITALTVTDLPNKKPVRAKPAIERSAYEPNANFPNIFWPAAPVTVLHSGFGDQLNVIAGQFRPNPGSAELGSERQIQSISVDIAYTTDSDNIRPLVKQVGAVMTGGSTAIAFVEASDESGPLNKVAVLYNDGVHNFKYQQLSPAGGNLFTATLTGLSRPPEIIGEARDGSGNVGIAANKAVNYSTALTDKSAPSIRIDSPVAGGVFTLGQQVKARYKCSDPGGVKSCIGTVPVGALVDTSSVGDHTFTVTATDLSNNTVTKEVSYSVHFAFLGFFPPVDNPPVINTVKAGNSVPLKWKLQNSAGAEITSLDVVLSVSSQQIPCVGGPLDQIEQTVSPTLVPLKYDSVAMQYVYTWQTQKAWAGTCRRIFVAFSDDSDPVFADFMFK
jgi:hypothetical protein